MNRRRFVQMMGFAPAIMPGAALALSSSLSAANAAEVAKFTAEMARGDFIWPWPKGWVRVCEYELVSGHPVRVASWWKPEVPLSRKPAARQRWRYSDEVTADQVARYDALFREEFQTGTWV